MSSHPTSHRSRRLRSVMLLCAVWGTGFAQVARDPEVHSENSVKAAFVLRFTGYVEWPAPATPAPTFGIAVLGDNNVAVQLQRLVADRVVQGRAVQVRRIARIEDLGNAQILYVGADRREGLRAVLASIGARSVLVVTNENYGLESGSTINLLVADQRVRFEVSLEAARRAQLRISSELLSLAVRVHGTRRGDAAWRPADPLAPAGSCCDKLVAAVWP